MENLGTVTYIRVRVSNLKANDYFYIGKLHTPCFVLRVNDRTVICRHSYDNLFQFILDANEYVYTRKFNNPQKMLSNVW